MSNLEVILRTLIPFCIISDTDKKCICSVQGEDRMFVNETLNFTVMENIYRQIDKRKDRWTKVQIEIHTEGMTHTSRKIRIHTSDNASLSLVQISLKNVFR